MIIVTIAGNVGKNAEMRRAGDQDVCGFSVACQDPKDRKGEPIWFDVSIWGKRGEALCEHISKGDKVTVTGVLSFRKHEGETYYKVDASEIALQGGSGKPGARDDDDRGSRSRDRDDRPAARDDRRDDRRDSRRDDRPPAKSSRADDIPY